MSCGDCRQKKDYEIPLSILEKTNRHPCYTAGAHDKYARMHVPVAPRCNIGCNYCNRKFDCVNESRPGVTSEILTPQQAADKVSLARKKIDNLSVVGIAGPGDALANWPETSRTLELIKQREPDIIFCLSTNGLMLPDYAWQIVELGVNHITVTVNCMEPTIGEKIYRYVDYHGKRYTKTAGGEILLNNQLNGINYLVQQGVLVKVNIVMIKGINDTHIPVIVQRMKELGVFVTNIMPLIPAPGSVFQDYPQTSMKELTAMRKSCAIHLSQMYHCCQCRADAIGLLGNDRAGEFRAAESVKEEGKSSSHRKDYQIAVASKHGILVDQHFGHAEEFSIFRGSGEHFSWVETRKVAKYCLGVEECDTEENRRDKIIETIRDCDAVLVMRIGFHARERLTKQQINCIEYCDTVENGLRFAADQLTAAGTTSKLIG